jgi:uncharacterized membrane protein (DUF106 family)
MKRIKSIILHRIKRYLSKRRKSDLKKALKELKENQSKIVEIANYLISHTDSKLVYSVLSGTFFIEYKEVICRIESDRIIVTNGLYSYDISIPTVIAYDLTKRFLNHLESRKRGVERKINLKLTSSLGRVHQ